MTPEHIAAFNNATPEQIARTLEQLPTDVLEWAIAFEGLAQAGQISGNARPSSEADSRAAGQR